MTWEISYSKAWNTKQYSKSYILKSQLNVKIRCIIMCINIKNKEENEPDNLQ